MKTFNKSPGSLFVGKDLPKEYQKPQTLKGDDLQVLIKGKDERPRPVTFIMGSAEKGWHLTCKGSGPFPTGEVEYTLLEVEGREVEEVEPKLREVVETEPVVIQRH